MRYVQYPMHEMSLVQSIMNIVEEERDRHKLDRVVRVTLMNGRLAGAVTDALEFAWEALRQGTEFEDCELKVVEVPLKVVCGRCGKDFEPEDTLYMPCPHCGLEFGHQVVEGKELYVANIEADEPD